VSFVRYLTQQYYFRTLGRPEISGRDFSSGDDASVPFVVMVNESFAAAYWPGQQALGQRLRMMDQNRPGPCPSRD
jgi:hypothetical protein